MLAVAGSGLAVQHLLPESGILGLLASAFATAGALVGLIIAFGSVSGGHFNPLITGLQWLGGERKLDCTLAYVAAQFAGAILGVLAAAGLMIVVFGCARSGRTETGPFAVGAWLSAAIVATPSSSYANPAITLAALVAAGPIALPRTTALLYVAAEVVGALVSFAVIAIAYPRANEPPAANLVVAAQESLS
jgi:glycerol uptake facilitator-like aquaporin